MQFSNRKIINNIHDSENGFLVLPKGSLQYGKFTLLQAQHFSPEAAFIKREKKKEKNVSFILFM